MADLVAVLKNVRESAIAKFADSSLEIERIIYNYVAKKYRERGDTVLTTKYIREYSDLVASVIVNKDIIKDDHDKLMDILEGRYEKHCPSWESTVSLYLVKSAIPNVVNTSAAMFIKCPKCESKSGKGCEYQMVQTKSADEPATIMCRCLDENCDHSFIYD
jgi:DNA-directed RNA polymerase subunit M/transcription elongation factor TFIIS